jgi:putative peptidoglycan lipid II flippase
VTGAGSEARGDALIGRHGRSVDGLGDVGPGDVGPGADDTDVHRDDAAEGPETAGSGTAVALARAGIVVSAAFLASRVLGWVRLVVIGNGFTPSELDTFFAAFRLPDLIFQLVAAGAVGSALIPIVAGLLATSERERAWRVVSTVVNLILVALAVLAVALAIVAPVVVRAITPGFDEIRLAQTVELTRIMLLSPIFLALGAVATSVLNAGGRFAAAAIAPIVYNLAIIGGAVILAPSLGVNGLALGVVCGSLGHLLVQLRGLGRIGFTYQPAVDIRDPQARDALRLMAPRAVGLGAGQITFVVVTSLASTLGTGAITAYNIAFALLQIPIGVIGVPLGVVVFPSLSREVALGRVNEYVGLLMRALRLLLYVMLPLGGLLAILRRQAVTLLFGYGRFDAASIDLTANALLFFVIGLAAHALIAVLARAFYARQDTRTPVVAAILAVVVNTTLAILLVGPLGLGGIALAIAAAAWIEALVLLGLLARWLPGFGLADLGRVGLEAALGTLIAGAVGVGVLYGIDGLIGPEPAKIALAAQGILVSAAFGVTYLVLSLALRIPELPSIVAVMTDLVRRRGRS